MPAKIVASDKFKSGDIVGAITDGYLNTDNELLRLCDNENWPDGATGVVGIIHDDKLYTCSSLASCLPLCFLLLTLIRLRLRAACVGDSELVISVEGVAQCRSFKHKPTVPSERARIQAAGGVVIFDRLGASMAVSRSFGDKVRPLRFAAFQRRLTRARRFTSTRSTARRPTT